MQIGLIISGIVVAGFIALYLTARAKMKNLPQAAENPNILTLSDANFQQQIRNKVVLVDFWAAWCAPCRMMAPVLNEVANELPAGSQVGKVDIEKYQSLAQKFKIRSIPTLVLFKDGREVNRFVGIKTKGFLLKEIARVKG